MWYDIGRYRNSLQRLAEQALHAAWGVEGSRVLHTTHAYDKVNVLAAMRLSRQGERINLVQVIHSCNGGKLQTPRGPFRGQNDLSVDNDDGKEMDICWRQTSPINRCAGSTHRYALPEMKRGCDLRTGRGAQSIPYENVPLLHGCGPNPSDCLDRKHSTI